MFGIIESFCILTVGMDPQLYAFIQTHEEWVLPCVNKKWINLKHGFKKKSLSHTLAHAYTATTENHMGVEKQQNHHTHYKSAHANLKAFWN